ncbi:hypothetical protein ACG873_21770 [Mesorhizobium sp. AaZ16]|uniref:hypothetical protein n=1 Tax=Mesorhizobium sp. AaZ16 TaxID=3402289 RepID=UPI00374F7653
MVDDKGKIGRQGRAREAANQDYDVSDIADRFDLSPIKARALMKLFYGNDYAALKRATQKPKMTADAELVSLEEALREKVRRELEIARAKYGEHFELLCIEGSRGDTIDDRKALQLLRSLNRTGSM